MASKRIYEFEEGSQEMKSLLGGKGAGLAEMTKIGLPVPYGFTITTEVCNEYYKFGGKFPPGLEDEILEHLKKLEKKTKKIFGSSENPLLVSVRSGAPVSMPGMMDTILNLGLNDLTVEGLSELTKDKRFAYDSYRRFITMFSNVVMGIEHKNFEEILEEIKERLGVKSDAEIPYEGLKEVVDKFKELYKKETGEDFPQDPYKQLMMAIEAVFKSWNNKRAIEYRRIYKIPEDLGTAVNIQMMVFGNAGYDSGTGVGFTRDPATGENKLYGEYLLNAQGEDVVAGIRTPKPIEELKNDIPSAYEELLRIKDILEKHYRDIQDFEFTIEKGKLFMLQTRTGQRTPIAAVKIAVDMFEEGVISKEEAVMRVNPYQVELLLHPMIDPKANVKVIAKGLPASPGAAYGKVVFDTDEAALRGNNGDEILLVRPETTPEDIHGMVAAKGILTARGGMTCIDGETILLTDKGFLKAKEIYEGIREGEFYKILSLNSSSLEIEWKDIIAAGRRISKTVRVSISQSGRSNRGIIEITPDHKIYTLEDRELKKIPLDRIFEEKRFVFTTEKIPSPDLEVENENLAYIAGVIFTDGYINLKRTKGSVTFTQKFEGKEEFISEVDRYFSGIFNERFNILREKTSSNVINGKTVSGSAVDLICTKRKPAEILNDIYNNLTKWVLSLDETSTLNFLAGVIDGDGTFAGNRFQIFVSKKNLLEGIVVSCLKLGISPTVTKNRNIFNVIIREKIDEISPYLKRVKVKSNKRYYGTKFFGAKELFSDIINKVNYKGRIKQMIKRNLLIDSEKIKRDILPIVNKDSVKKDLEKLIKSPLRMLRVKKIKDLDETFVYNFEVDSINEMDKNFVIFAKNYTPLIVSNSHAAVVARGMGKPCVVGCEEIKIDMNGEFFVSPDGTKISKDEYITIDGGTGRVILGKAPLIEPEISGNLEKLLKFADEIRKLGVRANANTPEDAKKAKKFGAEGIGLLRIERMFLDPERLPIVQDMIMAKTKEEREIHLKKIVPMIQKDFEEMIEVMDNLPVTIRLLDPPLHEFLPQRDRIEEEIKSLKENNGNIEEIKKRERILRRIKELYEHNPMIGWRGCRVGIVYPEIYEAMIEAIIMAGINLKRKGFNPVIEIMHPLVAHENELKILKDMTLKVAQEVMKREGVEIKYLIGTMIEVPRAALCADKIAKYAEFFSFGTNDLTQTTYAFSRDDVEASFLPFYIDKKILPENPFMVLDIEGVGKLVEIGTKLGKESNPQLEVGICGEHGGEPASVKFFHKAGLDYVSCSPFRIPIARLSAAQAVVEEKFAKKEAYSDSR